MGTSGGERLPVTLLLRLKTLKALKYKVTEKNGRLGLVDPGQRVYEVALVFVQADLDDLVAQVRVLGIHRYKSLGGSVGREREGLGRLGRGNAGEIELVSAGPLGGAAFSVAGLAARINVQGPRVISMVVFRSDTAAVSAGDGSVEFGQNPVANRVGNHRMRMVGPKKVRVSRPFPMGMVFLPSENAALSGLALTFRLYGLAFGAPVIPVIARLRIAKPGLEVVLVMPLITALIAVPATQGGVFLSPLNPTNSAVRGHLLSRLARAVGGVHE
jgi:hypothetical protein